jgi:mannitol/fructose-specific phosphotransferase system IIA component (Ntr-type)
MGNLLGDIFDMRSIKLDLDGKTKEMAIDELVDTITILHPELDRSEFYAAISEREEKMSTGIANGVAIPHAFCGGIGNMAGAIGISKKGIDYGALDNRPVHIVFLLAISQRANENHLRVLNLIIKFAQSEALALMKNAKDADEIYSILSRIH